MRTLCPSTVSRFTLVTLAFGLAAAPGFAVAQQPPPSEEIYQAMPPPNGAPSGQPEAYGQPNPYGQQWQPAPDGADPNAPAAPPVDGEIGYDDAGYEAWAQEQSETDAGYVDDGYDVDAYVEYEATLSPYGSWVNTADYGRVWSPSTSYVGGDFMPYSTGGHWVLSEYGWTWVSDWDWGWAPFHYGRWLTVGSYGWCWIPGRVWGPAWVSWRWGGGYVGWSPLPPRGVRIAAPPAIGAHGSWRFARALELGNRRMSFVTASMARTAFSATRPLRNVQTINRYRVEAGPHLTLVSTTLGRALQPTPVHGLTVAAPRATIVPRLPPSALAPRAAMPGYRGTPAYHQPMISQPGFRAPQTYTPQPAAQPAWRGTPTPGTNPAWRQPSAPSYNAPGWRANTPVAPAPAYNNAPVWRSPPAAAPSYSSPAYRQPPAPSYNQPAFRQSPSYSAPVYRPSPSPSYNAPAYRPSPAPSYSAPAFRQSPSYSAPAYRPSPAPSYSAPSFRSSPAPSYSPPAMHSAPSRPSFSAPSAPSAPRPSMHFGGRR